MVLHLRIFQYVCLFVKFTGILLTFARDFTSCAILSLAPLKWNYSCIYNNTSIYPKSKSPPSVAGQNLLPSEGEEHHHFPPGVLRDFSDDFLDFRDVIDLIFYLFCIYLTLTIKNIKSKIYRKNSFSIERKC